VPSTGRYSASRGRRRLLDVQRKFCVATFRPFCSLMEFDRSLLSVGCALPHQHGHLVQVGLMKALRLMPTRVIVPSGIPGSVPNSGCEGCSRLRPVTESSNPGRTVHPNRASAVEYAFTFCPEAHLRDRQIQSCLRLRVSWCFSGGAAGRLNRTQRIYRSRCSLHGGLAKAYEITAA
jgi:hypothetical protein